MEHENGEAKNFYATLPSPARVGMEATCDAQRFERVLREHHHELWIGDAAAIRAAMVRKQKTDAREEAENRTQPYCDESLYLLTRRSRVEIREAESIRLEPNRLKA